MVKSKILRILNKSLVISIIISSLSFVTKIIPCKTIRDDSASWGLCKLPNPFTDLSTLTTKFYGAFNNPLTGLVFQFILSFIIATLIFFLIRKKAAKVLDLTKNS